MFVCVCVCVCVWDILVLILQLTVPKEHSVKIIILKTFLPGAWVRQSEFVNSLNALRDVLGTKLPLSCLDLLGFPKCIWKLQIKIQSLTCCQQNEWLSCEIFVLKK